MFRSASRTILRHANASATHQQLRFAQARRFVNTAAKAEKGRSWKNSALRWGLAVGAVYYYNTSSVFAEDPELALQNTSAQQSENAPLPTIESVAAAKKQRAAALAAEAAAAAARKSESEPEPQSESEPAREHGSDAAAAADVEVAPTESQPLELTPGELEAEADQQGAFNPETGEINWDCPCLGGMAHGPCGEEFKAAFSCFVYSTEEPKGMDCIDKFKGMQDCFRLHPDVYGGELDEDEVDQQLNEHIAAEDAAAAAAATETSAAGSPVDVEALERKQVKQDIENDLDATNTIHAPEKWHDTTQKNAEVEQEEKKQ